MVGRLRFLAVLLGIPLFAFAVAQFLLLGIDDETRRVCADAGVLTLLYDDERCTWYARFRLMRNTAVGIAAAAIAWAGLIAVAGRLARLNRMLLVRVFRPALHATLVFVIVLIALHGALAVAALFLAEVALVGFYHPIILALVSAGALIGLAAVARTAFSIAKPATMDVLGRPLEHRDAPELWRLVDAVATRVGVGPPDHLVAGLDLNFFVTEAEVHCSGVNLAGRVLFVSLPLARLLTAEELGSAIGHELGHFKGQDTEFSRRFYPVYRGTTDALGALAANETGTLGSIALIPAAAMLIYFLESFATAESAIGRERELAADAVGAIVAGPTTTASALVKFHAFAKYWEPVHQAMVDAVTQQQPLENVSMRFAADVAVTATATDLAGLDEVRLPHPTDSHPPLGARLAHLGVTLDSVKKMALDVAPVHSAIELVPYYEKLESELSSDLQALFGGAIGIDATHKASPADRA